MGDFCRLCKKNVTIGGGDECNASVIKIGGKFGCLVQSSYFCSVKEYHLTMKVFLYMLTTLLVLTGCRRNQAEGDETVAALYRQGRAYHEKGEVPQALECYRRAAEEIFVNIANYAYGKSTGFAEILAEVKNGEITIVFKDGGIRYNPLAKEDPDITLSAEDRAIGGLGIFLVKKNMDSVFYENKDGKNIFTITKKLD